MIYILFVCFCLFFMASWRRIKKVQLHDGVLFPFCRLRRDIMGFLHENVLEKSGSLSRKEYASVRRLSNALDIAIHNYNQHKTVMFNLRKVVQYLKQYRRTAKQADTPTWPDNPEIQKFHLRFALCLAAAFLAYTPLLRSELALKVLVLAYRVRHRTISDRLLRYVLAVARQARDTARQPWPVADGAIA